jgi:hypothetical protein
LTFGSEPAKTWPSVNSEPQQMPKIVPPGQYRSNSISGKRKAPKTLRVNSTKALRLRALAVIQAAEQGIMSTADADRLTRMYQRTTEMMLAEHELKQAGIRDEVPDDNAPDEPLEIELGTHQKRKATVKRVPGPHGGAPVEERTVTVELSGVDPDALAAAHEEHNKLIKREIDEALRPLDDE